MVLPPGPLQVNTKVLAVAVRLPVLALPEVGWVPDQSPEALQAVALVDDHVSREALPLVTEVGLALRETEGAGA